MSSSSRPSLDTLVPLMMIENQMPNDMNEDSMDEPQKEVLRYFESGDLVLVRTDSNCLPAIVFNASGLVMKFDIDRQLYHVCLLDKGLTEQWVDATDMIIYSVPMIADCEDEQTSAMWSTANELVQIPNKNEIRTRLEEFQKRFHQMRQEQEQSSPVPRTRKVKSVQPPVRRPRTLQGISLTLTICEEFLIIDTIHRVSQCSFAEAKRIAEEAYWAIVCTNNRGDMQSHSMEIIPEQWFVTLITGHIEHFRQFAKSWLPNLEAMTIGNENNGDLCTLISLMMNESI